VEIVFLMTAFASSPRRSFHVPVLSLYGANWKYRGKHVLPFRRERRIENRRNRDVENGRGGNLAVLRGVEGFLKIIDFVADVNAAGKRFAGKLSGEPCRKAT